MARREGSKTSRALGWVMGPALSLLVAGAALAATGDPPSAEAAAAAPTVVTPAAAPPAATPTLAPATPLRGLLAAPNVPSPEALERAVSAWRAHDTAGKADLAAGKWASAERHFRAALVLDPSDAPRLRLLAETLDGAGARHRATITLRTAVSLAFGRQQRALGWTAVARNAESRGLTTEAFDAWMRVRSLEPDPAIDERLDALRTVEPVVLMSPRSLCPQLLDDWGCAPSTRPAAGDMRCSCTIERYMRAPAALTGGLRSDDDFGIARLDARTLLAAALVRVRGAGTALLDTYHLAVETGSGGWQLVSRVVEGWQPGAPYTARDGALLEFDFRSIGDVQRHGPSIVLQVVNRYAEASFDRVRTTRAREEGLVLCHAQNGMRCISLATALRLTGRPFPGKQGEVVDGDWGIETRIEPDGALVVTHSRGQLPAELKSLPGSHPLDRLDELPGAVVIPLR